MFMKVHGPAPASKHLLSHVTAKVQVFSPCSLKHKVLGLRKRKTHYEPNPPQKSFKKDSKQLSDNDHFVSEESDSTTCKKDCSAIAGVAAEANDLSNIPGAVCLPGQLAALLQVL